MLGAVPAGDDDGPPWPLTRDEVRSFATGGLSLASLEELPSPDNPAARRWRAVLHR